MEGIDVEYKACRQYSSGVVVERGKTLLIVVTLKSYVKSFDWPQLLSHNADPLACGYIDAGDPIWNPRIYFLTILHHRLIQVKKEWRGVVEKVAQSFRLYEQVRLSQIKRWELDQLLD